jgi:hypothetical protein
LSKQCQYDIGPISNCCGAMAISMHTEWKLNNCINKMNLLLHFMRYILYLFKMSAWFSLCSLSCSTQDCLLNHFRVFLYVSSSIISQCASSCLLITVKLQSSGIQLSSINIGKCYWVRFGKRMSHGSIS